MAKAFAEGSPCAARVMAWARSSSPTRRPEGWEALLSGMIRGGWTITSSWPIATEMTITPPRSRFRRPGNQRPPDLSSTRPEDAPVGDWADVLRELPDPCRRLDAAAAGRGHSRRGPGVRLRRAGAGDLQPLFRAVETAEGREIKLPEYLEKVWEVVGREALRQVLGTAEAQARNGLAARAGRGRPPDRAVPLDAAKHRDLGAERQ